MHIPTKNAARQLLDGLDAERRDVADALSRRFGTLSPDQLQDEKVLRQAFMLELQARCAPDLAARIAYTSEDMLIPLAVALVRARAEQASRDAFMSKLYTGLIVLGAVLCVSALAYFWLHGSQDQASTESPSPSRQTAPAR